MIAMKLGWVVLEGICVWLTLYYGSSEIGRAHV